MIIKLYLNKLTRYAGKIIKSLYYLIYSFCYVVSASSNKKIVLISGFGHIRVLKIAEALNLQGYRPILITQNKAYLNNVLFEKVVLSQNDYHALYIASKKYKGSVFHVFCNWNYFLPKLLIRLKVGQILVDTFDVMSYLVVPSIEKIYKKQIHDEKYCMTHADGLVCRDLRTNILKKNNWKLPPRILFMDYINSISLENTHKILKKDVVYLGNIEMDAEKDAAFQYDLSKLFIEKKICFNIYPSRIEMANTLRQNFNLISQELLINNGIYIHDTVPPELVPKILSNSSYGLLISGKNVNFYDSHDTSLRVNEKYFFAAKIFDYYQSGVFPIVQNGGFVGFIIKRMGVGAVVNSFDEIIDVVEKNSDKEIIINYNKTLTLEYNSSRLFAFYKQYL